MSNAPTPPLSPNAIAALNDIVNNRDAAHPFGSPIAVDSVLHVLAIFRYTVDDRHLAVSRQTSDGFADAFDVVLSDGTSTVKLLLASIFNKNVHSGALQQFDVIRVKSIARQVDEKILQAEPFGILVEYEHAGRLLKHQLESFSDTLTPLTRGRVYYSDLYSLDFPSYDSRWSKLNINLTQDQGADGHPIGEIISKHAELDAKPSIMGRVVRKTDVSSYAKPGSRQLYPIIFGLVIADDTGAIPVVFWNDLCARFYQSIAVGDVLVISGFKLQPAYQATFPNFPYELSLNQSHPEAQVSRLTPTGHFDTLSYSGNDIFPPASAIETVVPIALFDRLTSSTTITLAGIITAVGPIERERLPSSKFVVYRWICVVDLGAGAKAKPSAPFWVRVGTCSQSGFISSALPGQAVLLTRLKFVRPPIKIDSTGIKSDRTTRCFGVTTRESQFYSLPTERQTCAGSAVLDDAAALTADPSPETDRLGPFVLQPSAVAMHDAAAMARTTCRLSLETIAIESRNMAFLSPTSQVREYLASPVVKHVIAACNATSLSFLRPMKLLLHPVIVGDRMPDTVDQMTELAHSDDGSNAWESTGHRHSHPPLSSLDEVKTAAANLHLFESMSVLVQGTINSFHLSEEVAQVCVLEEANASALTPTASSSQTNATAGTSSSTSLPTRSRRSASAMDAPSASETVATRSSKRLRGGAKPSPSQSLKGASSAAVLAESAPKLSSQQLAAASKGIPEPELVWTFDISSVPNTAHPFGLIVPPKRSFDMSIVPAVEAAGATTFARTAWSMSISGINAQSEPLKIGVTPDCAETVHRVDEGLSLREALVARFSPELLQGIADVEEDATKLQTTLVNNLGDRRLLFAIRLHRESSHRVVAILSRVYPL
ncbi:hypothetical protein CAOG_07677 [Capsaspora owczarzaki ATCC 30864]|nr:hypothetical protein CAOG_07677 [Capsaspora owczarzaki ATCC 30864]|eukprot:XP_004343551.2 hypothetical protein CAOG_07677 [Capsaspora owczarzaki ATCC 30864]